jgi:hypothetical protein
MLTVYGASDDVEWVVCGNRLEEAKTHTGRA